MPNDNWEETQRYRDERKAQMALDMTRAMADNAERFDFDEHPLPWTWCIAFHDHLFFQFMDANGRPCIGNDLTDPEDAARILKIINGNSSL